MITSRPLIGSSKTDPNTCDLHAGIAGAHFSVDTFDFGEGVTLSKTYAHLMAPFLMAFAPAKKGKAHPAPWEAVSNGIAYDIHTELHIPNTFQPDEWFDRVNTIWWIVSLLRIKGNHLAFVPVISQHAFSQILALKESPDFWLAEVNLYRLVINSSESAPIGTETLGWIAQHWISAGKLMRISEDFSTAYQALDECHWLTSPSLALVLIWGALERLFCPSHHEITFKISATIASYLEPPGDTRMSLYKKIKKLYKSRSKAAHGSTVDDTTSFPESYSLLKRILIKMVEENHVPTQEELVTNLMSGGENLLAEGRDGI